MASTWIPGTKRVLGSSTGHACSTNSRSFRRAFSVFKRFRLRSCGLHNLFELVELFVGEFGVIEFLMFHLVGHTQGLCLWREPLANILNWPSLPGSRSLPEELRGLLR